VRLAPHWFGAPTLIFGVKLRDLRGLRRTRPGGNEVIRCHPPLLSFASRSESYSSVLTLLLSRRAQWTSRSLRRASYPGVYGSSTLSEADSDLHSAYLTELCCAFRLSQSLDALFHPRPFRPYFVSVTPLNFHLQRFSLSGPGRHLSMSPAPLAVFITESSMTRGFRGCTWSKNPFSLRQCYPRTISRSSLGVLPSEVYSSSVLASLMLGLLSWASARARPTEVLRLVPALQSFKEPRSDFVPSQARTPSVGFLVLLVLTEARHVSDTRRLRP